MMLFLFRVFVLTILPLAVSASPLSDQLAALEASANGQIGLSAINMNNHSRIQYRANERFPTGCTSKVIGVAAILQKSRSNPAFLRQKVMYSQKDLTNWTPITEKHLADGMTIEDLSAAAISYSDNTAMNLLLNKLGGPQAMTAFARSMNDRSFRQDHGWPEEALAGAPGDQNDSSTPAAMEASLYRLAFGDVLGAHQKERLLTWMKNNTTGNSRIRAGVPTDWVVGDKTGTGFYYGITNDIAIIWPPKCFPIVIAIYFKQANKNATKREDILAAATKLVIEDFMQKDACLRKT